MPPQAFGELMLVPFINWEPRSVQLGTDAIAAPGALMHTPSEPSCLRRMNNNSFAASISTHLTYNWLVIHLGWRLKTTVNTVCHICCMRPSHHQQSMDYGGSNHLCFMTINWQWTYAICYSCSHASSAHDNSKKFFSEPLESLHKHVRYVSRQILHSHQSLITLTHNRGRKDWTPSPR